MRHLLSRLSQFLSHLISALDWAFLQVTRVSRYSIALSIVTDLPRSKIQLIAENALLRQQLIILNRQVKNPRFT